MRLDVECHVAYEVSYAGASIEGALNIGTWDIFFYFDMGNAQFVVLISQHPCSHAFLLINIAASALTSKQKAKCDAFVKFFRGKTILQRASVI